jgi:hypothetical protein
MLWEMLVNDELEWIWMQRAVAYFKILSQYPSERSEKNYENPH